ncbi:MAG: PEP-CTERM sorting domain-containing protein [Planctomycetota bacterium]
MNKSNALTCLKRLLPVVAVAGFSTAPAFADGDDDGDGLPHIAIAQEGAGTPSDPFEFELEFAVDAGLDESTTPPTLTVVTPDFEPGGYTSRPLAPGNIPNADLGFVSEIEGVGENVVIAADIVVQLIEKDANFAVFQSSEIFVNPLDTLSLGNQFDEHPTWVLANAEGDFTSATALFEVFDVTDGGIGSGAESLGQFRINLVVPEPTSLVLFGLAAPALMLRRRRG